MGTTERGRAHSLLRLPMIRRSIRLESKAETGSATAWPILRPQTYMRETTAADGLPDRGDHGVTLPT